MRDSQTAETSSPKSAEAESAPRDDPPLIVCCSSLADRKWRWFEHQAAGRTRWEFHYRPSLSRWANRIPYAWTVALTYSCWRAVRSAKRNRARMLITHDPRVTFRVARLQKALGARMPHVAWSFNFDSLPQGLLRSVMAGSFACVDRFIVFSSFERALYHETFDIPISKIEMAYWGVGEPTVAQPETPIESGDYICAVGGNARDYPTLMAAMELIPEIPLVVVMRPQNAVGLKIPPNVRVRLNQPLYETNNIIKFSRFMVLPLRGSDVPCGHVTLVNAMFLGRAIVITQSSGVDDYIHEDVNAVTCGAKSPEALADVIRALWNDPERSARLGTGGRRFAEMHCTEASMKANLDRVLREFGVLTDDLAPESESSTEESFLP